MANFTPTGVTFVAQGLNKYLGDLGKADKSQQNLGKSASGLTGTFSSLGAGITSVGLAAGTAAVAGIAALGAGIAAIGTTSVSTAISFESAFTGVLKTTDGLTDSVGDLNQAGQELRQGFVDLSKEVPTTFEELAAIGELGGQLGIGKDALLDFTETIAALGVSTNLTEEEAGTALARISNIFQITGENAGKNISQLGSTIVALGNNFATTERDIVAFGERIAGAGAIAGLSQADILSIGTALSSVGVEAEAGGTAVQKVLLNINNAVNGATTGFVDNTEAIDKNVRKLTSLNANLVTLEAKTGLTGNAILQMQKDFIAAGGSAEEFGRQLGDTQRRKLFETAQALEMLTNETKLLRNEQGKPIDAGQLQQFAKVAGLSATEFEQAWKEDAAGAFQLFVEGLGREGDNAANVLDELGLADQRLIRAFLSLSGAGDLLGRTLETGNQAFEDNNALAQEAAKRYATTESQLLILKNTLRAMGDTIGSRFLPIINDAISVGKEWLDSFVDPLGDVLDNTVIPAIENFISSVFNLVSAFQTGGTGGLLLAIFGTDDLATIGATLITQAQTILESLITSIVSFATSQAQTIQTAFFEMIGVDSIQQAFGLMLANIPVALQNILNAITGFISTQAPTILTTLGEWANTFIMWIDSAVNLLAQNLGAILLAIAAWATSGAAQQQLNALGMALGQNLVTGLEILFSDSAKIIGVMTKLVLALAAGVAAIAGILIVVGGQIVAGILAGILEKLGVELQPAMFSELGNILKQLATDALIIAKVVGLNIILGIIGGIEEGIEDLRTTVSQIGTIITTTVSEQLGIQSPSTVFFEFGMNMVQGMIDGIMSLGGSLLETIGGLFAFGEEGGGEMSMDFLPNLESMTMMQENLALLQEQFTIFFELVNIGLVNITTATFAFNELLLLLSISTMPMLNATAMMFFTSYMSQMTMIIGATMRLSQTILQLKAIIASSTKDMIAKFDDTKSSVESLIETIRVDFGKAIEEAISKVNNWIRAMKEAAATRASLKAGSGDDAARGLGFASGTGPLGFLVPPGFPNDSFPINVQSGERVLVAPRGRSIESITGTGDRSQVVNINATVNNGMDEQILIERIRRVTAQGLS